MEVLIIVCVLGLITSVITFTKHFDKKRQQALLQFAQSKGFKFSPYLTSDVYFRRGELPFFSRGRSKHLRNILERKSPDYDVTIFDYSYVVGSGKNTNHYINTVVQFNSKELSLPGFILRPEHIFHKIGDIFGYQDIDFPSHPEFSRNYILRGVNETHIRQVFNASLLQFFGARPGARIEGSGDTLIVYREGSTVRPEELAQFLTDAEGAFRLFVGR